jgi:hypothetical protein
MTTVLASAYSCTCLHLRLAKSRLLRSYRAQSARLPRSQSRKIKRRLISGQPDDKTCRLMSVSGPLSIRCSCQSFSRIRSAYPADSKLGKYVSSSEESPTTSRMSMIGLAARPGTDVEPICSSRSARPPSSEPILSASRRKISGQLGSDSTIKIGEDNAFSSQHHLVLNSSNRWQKSADSRLVVEQTQVISSIRVGLHAIRIFAGQCFVPRSNCGIYAFPSPAWKKAYKGLPFLHLVFLASNHRRFLYPFTRLTQHSDFSEPFEHYTSTDCAQKPRTCGAVCLDFLNLAHCAP